MKQTQQQRIVAVLQSLQAGDHNIPEEYLRRHPSGDGVSARYFKHVMKISECNGRISELRGKGYDIETGKVDDEYGFSYHRLKPEVAQLSPRQRAHAMCELFDANAPSEQIFAV
jgi:hypothetical protein